MSGVRCLLLIASALGVTVNAADIRERIRLARPTGTAVSQAQADVLTLTLTQIQVRSIQNWVRTAGVVDSTGRSLVATLSEAEGRAVRVGQRARVFSPESKSSMYQARIVRVSQRPGETVIEARLSGSGQHPDGRCVLEVVVDYGEFLSVPNEAIVEEAGRQLVYVQVPDGSFQPREIETRLQGERYTQVLKGVTAGEQVVTTGSFFVDAEYKMKGGG